MNSHVRKRPRGPVRGVGIAALAAVAASAYLLCWADSAKAQTCLEQIVEVQSALRQQGGPPTQPAEQAQSVGAQDSQQPTPGSLAAAGLTEPRSGAWGALNEAMNLQAGGDEQGCLQALARARRLGGIQ